MCTLVIFRNVFSGRPIVVAANRDERFSRPAAPPAFTDGEVRILAPTDLERSGTWIGANDRPRLVAITNHSAIPSIRGLRSRGELVRDALEAPTTAHALASVMNRDPSKYNAFHLVILDREEGHLIVGNGVTGKDADGRDIEPDFALSPLADGISIITNLGFGAESPRSGAIMQAIRRHRIDQSSPRPSSLGALLSLHPGEIDGEGTCIHPTEEDRDYGTISSAIIRLNAFAGREHAWEYWHCDRPQGGAHRCSTPWKAPVELRLRAE